MKQWAAFPFFAVVLALGGCATSLPDGTLELTVTSQPPGAYISEKGSSTAGMAPLVMHYTAAKMPKDKNGCYVATGYEARWGSGAAASSAKTVLMCPPGNKFHYVLNRKPSDPGLDKDLAFANRLERQKVEDNNAVSNAILEGAAAGIAATSARPLPPQEIQIAPTRCVTKQVWGRIETECR